MIGLQRDPARPDFWGVTVLCDVCSTLVSTAGLVLWNASPPETPETVKGFLVTCTVPCTEKLIELRPEITEWGTKPLDRFTSELAIAASSSEQVQRDLAFTVKRKWDQNWRVETRNKRGGTKS